MARGEQGKKIWNWGGHIVDNVLQFLPQPIKDLPQKVTEMANSEEMHTSYETVKQAFSSVFASIKEEDSINLSPEDIPCGNISNICYDDPLVRERQIGTYTLIEKYNEIEYCVYRDSQHKKLIIGYRGTEVSEARDYISDVNIVLGTQGFNDRFQASLKVYEDICKEYPDDIKIITGHSLGGTICYMIAQAKDPDRTVVFNPGSGPNPTFLMMIKDTQMQAPRTKRVFTYKILGDVVSSLSVIGYTRTFHKASANPAELHAVKNFATPTL